MKRHYMISNVSDKTFYIVVFCSWLFISFPMFLLVYKHRETLSICSLINIVSVCLLYLLCRARRNSGIYIDTDKIYYRAFFIKKEILPSDIAGIKIIRSCIEGIYLSHELKDADKKQLYNIILLNTVVSGMYNYDASDLYFQRRYRKYVLCSVIYDKELVEYIEELNPNIIILGPFRDVRLCQNRPSNSNN